MSTTPAQGWRPLSELVRDLRKIAAMAPLELVGELAQRPAMAEAMMSVSQKLAEVSVAVVKVVSVMGLFGPARLPRWLLFCEGLAHPLPRRTAAPGASRLGGLG